MATSPRAAAPTGTSGRGWTIVRPLGSRAVATSLATGAPNEALVVQTFRLDDGDRAGDPVRDLRVLTNLRHTNVARIKEVVEKDSEVTIVSPFNDGETLAALRKSGPLPLAVELRIIVDVLAGLAAIHAAKDAKLKPLGIVHGEVAPANIVIGTDGVPKVIQLAGVHANPGVQGGDTLGYVAPEILLADDSFDQRVDVYSIGVVLWEALTGTTLFPETNAGAIVTRHLSGRIRKPTVPADSPWAEGLIEVAQKAIATDPGARYANANELSAEIKRIAKTNVAPTMKVSQAVKERGGEAINARRTALGLPALTIPKATAIAIKAPEPPKPTPEPPRAASTSSGALGPAPTPANGAPTTKPVPSEDIVVVAEEPIEKPAVRFVPPEPVDPAVHDRITSPSPIPVEKLEDQPADFSDLQFDSEPPPPPPPAAAPPGPPPKKTEVALSAPVPPTPQAPVLTPVPPAAFAPSPFVARTPQPDNEPSDTPAANPIASPFEPPISAPSEDQQKKKRTIVFIAVGAAALLLILGGLRSCMKGKPDPETAANPPTPTPTATMAAKTAEPTPTADPAITAAANTATSATAAVPTTTPEPTVAAKTDPTPAPTPSATNPPTTNTGGGGGTKPPVGPPVKKPKSYDPQGI